MNTAVYVLLRLFLWVFGVAIPLYPTLKEAPYFPSWNPFLTVEMVNQAGLFRDLFFIIGPAAAIALSSTLEYVWTHVILPKNQIVPAYFGGLTVVLVLLNFVVLLSSFIGFSSLPTPSAHTVLAPTPFSLYSWVIWVGLVVSLATEILMAVSNSWFHGRNHSHGQNTNLAQVTP